MSSVNNNGELNIEFVIEDGVNIEDNTTKKKHKGPYKPNMELVKKAGEILDNRAIHMKCLSCGYEWMDITPFNNQCKRPRNPCNPNMGCDSQKFYSDSRPNTSQIRRKSYEFR